MLLSRMQRRETLRGRSRCPHCQKVLHWYDLIPLVSFLLLSGRCRVCKKNISWKYPLIEAATALLSLLLVTSLPPMPLLALLFLGVAAYILLLIAFYDFETQNIPDLFVTVLFLSALLYRIFHATSGPGTELRDGFLGAAIPFFFFGALCIVSHEEWIGSGDILLGVAIGLLLGVRLTLLTLFLAYIVGAFIASFLILLHLARVKTRIAFGPFLASGALLSLFFGDTLLEWYGRVLTQ